MKLKGFNDIREDEPVIAETQLSPQQKIQKIYEEKQRKKEDERRLRLERTNVDNSNISVDKSSAPASPIPTIGQSPNIGEPPTNGNIPIDGNTPFNGDNPTVGNMPTNGQIPLNGQSPMVGNTPEFGITPAIGEIPNNGETPMVGDIPPNEPEPSQLDIANNPEPLVVVGQTPNNGNSPSVGHIPTTGDIPSIGHPPTVGDIPNIGQIPITGPIPMIGIQPSIIKSLINSYMEPKSIIRNYTVFDNDLFFHLTKFSGTEIKLYLDLYRRTWGAKLPRRAAEVTQAAMAGSSKVSAGKAMDAALKKLEQSNMIQVLQIGKGRGKVKTIIRVLLPCEIPGVTSRTEFTEYRQPRKNQNIGD